MKIETEEELYQAYQTLGVMQDYNTGLPTLEEMELEEQILEYLNKQL